MGGNASDTGADDKKNRSGSSKKFMSVDPLGETPVARVLMVRRPLGYFPLYSPPGGFIIRRYAPGDEEHWLAIHREAEKSIKMTPDFFTLQFGSDPQLLRQRQLYLLSPAGVPVGTSTAWFGGHSKGPEWGRVHWVAVRPEFQRRGLASILISATCARLQELGHKQAYLVTWSDRPWAIRLYEKFGFVRESERGGGFDR